AVAVDGHAGEAVGFTEDEAARTAGRAIAEEPRPEFDRGVDPVAPEGVVKLGGFVPGVETDANSADGIVQPAGDEVPGVGDDVDDVASDRIAFHAIDGPRENPRMAIEKRARPAWFEDEFGKAAGRHGRADLIRGTHPKRDVAETEAGP